MPEVSTTSETVSDWVTVELEEEDLVALSRCYYEDTPRGRRRTRMLYAFAVVMCALWAFAVRDHPEYGWHDPARYGLYVGIGIVVILAGFGFMLWYLRPTIARLSARLGAKRGMLTTTEFRLTPEQVELRMGEKSGKVRWDAVTGVHTTDAHCFILFGGLNGFIIPARAFESRLAFERFAEQAERCQQAARG